MPRKVRQWTPLTEEQKTILRRQYGKIPTKALARQFDCTPKQVYYEAGKMGLSFGRYKIEQNPWTDEMDAYLMENYQTGNMDEMEERLKKSKVQIGQRASRLGSKLSPDERKRRRLAGARKSGGMRAPVLEEMGRAATRRDRYEVDDALHLAMCGRWA